MKIKALQFYKGGYLTEWFAFGGSGKDGINLNKKYKSSLQNYLIDTGNEVILIDTGLPMEIKEQEKKEGQMIYPGEYIQSFLEALNGLGYEVEDIDKVIVTHKHPDHTGELRMFKNAKIYISEIEAEDMKLDGDNIIKVNFKDGKYKNFSESEKILDGLYMLPAYGHTKGNSIAILEYDNKYYMFYGDVTYTDEALRKNKLSVVFEDLELAKNTLNKVREFIKENDTVYLGTHTEESIESLKLNKIMKL